MRYVFCCEGHGLFEVNQSMLSEHKANCLTCGAECQRVYLPTIWRWGDKLFREDGSYREDKDYECLKG